jgi:hypothetical protein
MCLEHSFEGDISSPMVIICSLPKKLFLCWGFQGTCIPFTNRILEKKNYFYNSIFSCLG